MAFDRQNQTLPIAASQQDSFVNLKVIADGGIETTFKIRKINPLIKLMEVFCERNAFNMSSLRFLYDGNRIKEEDTPESLEMENGDSIDVLRILPTTEGESQVDQFVNITVIGYNDFKMKFKAKKTKPLLKLMELFSERSGLVNKQLKFLYDGHGIKEVDTPESLGMDEEHSIIDVVYKQRGGGELIKAV